MIVDKYKQVNDNYSMIKIKEFLDLHRGVVTASDLARACDCHRSTISQRRDAGWLIQYNPGVLKLHSAKRGATYEFKVELPID